MKNSISHCLLLILFLFVNLCFPFTTVFAETNIYYGRALSTGIYLYNSPVVTEDKSNKIFEIPVTYFVQLLNSENDLFYKASYNGIYGYVLKNEVSCINQTPITPYLLNVSFRVFTPGGANLRTSPYESKGASNLLTTIPFLDTNFLYYGICEGEEAISFKNNVWYYCKYIKQNQEYYGYVYAPLCDLLTPYAPNDEKFNYIIPNFITETTQPQEQYLSIQKPWQIILIVLVCLPCIAIIYFLFKPTKIAMQNAKPSNKVKSDKSIKKKKKISRLKHSDYYEMDSDYFN